MLKLLSKSLSLILLLFCFSSVKAQISNSDLILIENQSFVDESLVLSHPHYLFEGKSFIVKYNPISLTLGGMMFIYQKLVSPQFSAGCLYEPSCSNFSKKLISEYGIVKGVFLSADRLSRCNKLAAQEIHPLKIKTTTGKVNESVEIYRLKKK